MKCPVCNIIEMFVKTNDGRDITFECPSCHEIAKLKITEESK